ncbi:MAG TPA: glucosidase [Polyangiaceae bacterium]|nr:glucosidase [Polyangiaceae bacterium]
MTNGSDEERRRLLEAREGKRQWRLWGPYLSERQWGTVREDYSANGDAWAYFPHEHARSRAYRWGEDGLLGISDQLGLLCFALALWNEKDPILKERLYGLTNPQGNHGEDVKECYYYLDALPTAAYLRGLYKYPQGEFPYQHLIDENQARGKGAPEYELLDTGLFDENRYFDVFAEYAKAAPDDICIRLTIANRGPDAARLHVLPTLWFRNTWSWKGGYEQNYGAPKLRRLDRARVVAQHEHLGRYALTAGAGPDGALPDWLFTENETDTARLYGDANGTRHSKDAFHRFLVEGARDAVNPDQVGTKAAAHYAFVVPAGKEVVLKLRLASELRPILDPLGTDFTNLFAERVRETESYYRGLSRPEDESIVRQAAAGLIWSKQVYYYAVRDWLDGDPVYPPPEQRRHVRNQDWQHVFARDVISMPDKWEFPWFAAWDLAFHMLPFSLIDPDFAEQQLLLMLREWYQNPNGELAAYEYNFGDVNPPVHAWACMHLFRRETDMGLPRANFLKKAFQNLLLNYGWWMNRKDALGHNLFGGGFLGLDNIGVFDRSMPLPAGVTLDQADGTAWMGMFSSSMLSMALKLAEYDPSYEDMAVKLLQHFVSISSAINSFDGTGLWDEEDGFYYDHLRAGDRTAPLRVRSLVGLLPMIAVLYTEGVFRERLPVFAERVRWYFENVPGVQERIQQRSEVLPGGRTVQKWLIALPTRERLVRMLRVMLDENELLSPYGIRSVSRYHLEHPFVFDARGQHMEVRYLPGESDGFMFGGNSNWRGPIWFPINALIVESLFNYHRFYGDSLRVEFPTGSGNQMNLRDVALRLCERLVSVFRRRPDGSRPVHGDQRKYADDPYFRDLVLFYEYFHGDSGRGCGASHQTGWTATALVMAHVLRLADANQM